MIRHIVLWKFRPGTEAERERFLSGLAGLQGVIPELKACRVVRNVGEGNYDAALISDFDRPPAPGGLRPLQVHPGEPGGGGLRALSAGPRRSGFRREVPEMKHPERS